MLIHQYDAETGAYISSRLADADPLNFGRWLVPAFSTIDELPARTPLSWPFYLDGAWKLLPDYRGRILYRQDNGTPAEILVAGTTPAENGLTETPRPSDEYVFRDGAWAIDPAIVAQRVRAAAMAEFDLRMTHARTMNAGKADAYAAGLLSREEAYYFRAWSAYQLDLVRAIQREGFPDTVSWPDEPASFEVASAPAMAEYDARMTKAKTFTDGKAEAYAANELVAEDYYNYQAWSAYQELLTRAIDRETFPHAVVWPDEPAPYTPPLAPIPVNPIEPKDGATPADTSTEPA
ncbi:tail fiber assembly protein [Paraburkholderia diazotrophica]|uniref:Virus tail fibre assembly protein, lambda gpK n=1 Tax=Paraburkholderia diazotrophica TaxID=667676 RepID=A0A1H7EGG0_9BURK|nr:tail fiber assembly protein [Paraburkholderia diazotrophica]SEK13053.1 virus tail fibre assembly protein, lambda gpK [Paraburkholderia diazotrophica]